jgi:alkanesulfonate monooxygenase SsuD/methylene tetrahydromethanopterin reductase-like flavin-dependent oxidoreductase (luciferase family)
MKFGFFHTMPWTLHQKALPWPADTGVFDPAAAEKLYRGYLDCIASAEQFGFDWLCCNEHHFSPYGLMANCNLMGAALVYRTTSSRLAMVGNLVPMLNPIRVAEEYAMLDVMSGGRLIAGFMRGVPHEYLAYNANPSESFSRLREAIALITRAWTEPHPFAWEGEYFQYRAVSLWPKPYQKPHPRILLSTTNEESAAFAAEHRAMMGMAFISDLSVPKRNIEVYLREAKLRGWEPTPDDILIGQATCIAETDEEAKAEMIPALAFLNGILMGPMREAQQMVLQQTKFFSKPEIGRAFAGRLAAQKTLSIDQLIDGGAIFCGSPKSVVAQIKRVHAELKNGIFNLMMKVGNLSDDSVRRGMRLFKTEVLPHVAHL